CPVALAIRRVCKRGTVVTVLAPYAAIDRGERSKSIRLPTRVVRFIFEFDGGSKPKGLTFTLNIPAWARRAA
ncbi:MAG TPA: hypothetical protein VF435_03905, partial [Pyrinomonadaceae bacterium]